MALVIGCVPPYSEKLGVKKTAQFVRDEKQRWDIICVQFAPPTLTAKGRILEMKFKTFIITFSLEIHFIQSLFI